MNASRPDIDLQFHYHPWRRTLFLVVGLEEPIFMHGHPTSPCLEPNLKFPRFLLVPHHIDEFRMLIFQNVCDVLYEQALPSDSE